jgi:hypothetical protein
MIGLKDPFGLGPPQVHIPVRRSAADSLRRIATAEAPPQAIEPCALTFAEVWESLQPEAGTIRRAEAESDQVPTDRRRGSLALRDLRLLLSKGGMGF